MLVGGLVSNGVGLLVGLTVGAKVGLDVVGFVVGADVGIGEGRDVEMKFGMEVGTSVELSGEPLSGIGILVAVGHGCCGVESNPDGSVRHDGQWMEGEPVWS